MRPNDSVLNGRYTLTEMVTMPGVPASDLWEATDREGGFHTLKITPYAGDKPPSEIRRMWDNDLRVMYRLSSSAGATGQLVVMTDAGIDATERAMILVYEGSHYVTFAQELRAREETDWLSFKKLRERHVRRALWISLLQLAKGLKSLHVQNLIHRNVTPEAIWGRRGEGPESLRMSGFDWSARIGHATSTSERSPWATPPELNEVGFSFASDWYGFGTTVARCFFNLEHLNLESPGALANALSAAISRENPCRLEPLEKDFIKAITAPDRLDRLQHSTAIPRHIEKIIEVLDYGRQSNADGRRVLLFLDLKPQTIDAAKRAGFTPNPNDPFEAFNPSSPEHKVLLKDFLADQLRSASLSWSLDERRFELKCSCVFILGERWMDYGNSKEQSWRAAKAYLNGTTRLFESTPAKGFDQAHIEVEFVPSEVSKKIEPGSGFTAWDTFAPKDDATQGLEQDSENLRQFLHASNQFEILLRDAELFKYRIVNCTENGGSTKITVVPVQESRPARSFFKADKKLADFLQQEWDSAKPDCDKVLLTDTDSLFVSRAGANSSSERFDVDKEQWTISEIDQTNETITLFRQNSPGIAAPPSDGYIRTRGHYGQIRLIERRKQSIDRLSSHAYLLRTLASPGFTPIDAGTSELPWPQIEDAEKVIDTNKLVTIKDILRMRPMYALQGPPGTGKSTLVAHLLRQILEDDPMAQILVTAKDHAAVDVLFDKVIHQAYKDATEEQRPLAIRLNRRDGKDNAPELIMKLMRAARDAILCRTPPAADGMKDDIQRRWLRLLDELCSDADSRPKDVQELQNSMLDLVRRGASITYCTTSAGDLEELAKGARSVDWSIVEEAGKTHGFDLALPLQAGHRWLLLGDHKQLRPFLYEEFADCFNRLKGDEASGDGVIDILDALKSKPGNARIIDIEWLRAKFETDPNWAKSFPNFARGWLASFEKVFEDRRRLNGVTVVESIGASAGLLTSQYRMPPVIGDLNSTVFYNGEVRNATTDADGGPDADHCNPFVAPSWLAGGSLVWLDVPWTQEFKEYKKKGYSNNGELLTIRRFLEVATVAVDESRPAPYTIAVLTPYNMQKNRINADAINAPAGCQFGSTQGIDRGRYKAYSIDSFQGDEADIIVVSLVRNKLQAQGMPTATDIKFIAQPDRLNVMLSRPKRVLVIVGCWDYLSACVAEVSAATDAHGNYNDPEYGPFKRTLEELDAMFKGGRALKISVAEALK